MDTTGLPGAALIEQGLRDLALGHESEAALLVLIGAPRLREFMRLLGRRTRAAGRVYLVGGACSVLHDWRATTVDIDIDLDPELDALLREIPAIKEDLQVNVDSKH